MPDDLKQALEEMHKCIIDASGVPKTFFKKYPQTFMSMIYDDENISKNRILNHKGFTDDEIKTVCPNVLDSDIDYIKKLINKKEIYLQRQMMVYTPTTLSILSPDGFTEKMREYVDEINVQYDTHGLEKIYKKIERVLTEIPNTSEYKEDLQIVREIKQEYITTKKMPKSTMLYLNKIYKQITKNEEDDANTKSPGAPKEPDDWSDRCEQFKRLAGVR